MAETSSTITVGEVARLAGVSAVTVYRRVQSGRLPAPVSTDGVSRWDRAEVESTISEEQVLVTTQEAMRLLGVSRPTIYAMVRDGRLPAPLPMGNQHCWREEDVEALAAASRSKAGLSTEEESLESGPAQGWEPNRRGMPGLLDAYYRLNPAGREEREYAIEAPPDLRAGYESAPPSPAAQLRRLFGDGVQLAKDLQWMMDEAEMLAGYLPPDDEDGEPAFVDASAVDPETGWAQVSEFLEGRRAEAEDVERFTMRVTNVGNGETRRVNVKVIRTQEAFALRHDMQRGAQEAHSHEVSDAEATTAVRVLRRLAELDSDTARVEMLEIAADAVQKMTAESRQA